MNSDPIIIEQTFNVPDSKVWNAITVKDEMKNWYFQLEEFEPVVGFKFQFFAGDEKNKQYLHICEITEVIKNKKITYSWKYDGYPGISFVTFEIMEQNQKSLLKLTHKGVESFASGGLDFAKNNFIKGWTYLIQSSLSDYLEKK